MSTPSTPKRDDVFKRMIQDGRSTTTSANRCLACKIYQKTCDGSSPCYRCRVSYPGDVCDRICQRRLVRQLDDKLPEIPGVETNEWCILLKPESRSLRFKAQYAEPEDKITDLDICTSSPLRNFRDPSLVPYLGQFHDLGTRWEGYYEPFTVDLVERCAIIQEEMILRSQWSRDQPKVEDFLIVCTLRVFVLSRNITEVYSSWVSPNDVDNSPVVITSFMGGPTTTITRYNCSSENSGPRLRNGRKLLHMIQGIVDVLENMLIKQEPTNLPTLFCTICLLFLIQDNFRLVDSRIDFFKELEEPLEKVWNALAILLHMTAADYNPLTPQWNIEAYKTRIGPLHPSVAYLKSLNDHWIDGDFHLRPIILDPTQIFELFVSFDV